MFYDYSCWSALGKPSAGDCINFHLAYQQKSEGAGVCRLITKTKYHGNQMKTDYDTAFTQFAVDFKAKDFNSFFLSNRLCGRKCPTIIFMEEFNEISVTRRRPHNCGDT